MRFPQTLVALLSLLASACINLPDIEVGPPESPSGDAGVDTDAGVFLDGGYDGGNSLDGGVDQTPPTIVRTVPPNSATHVPLDATVEVDFSEEMNASTLRLSSIPPVAFELTSWTPETRRAAFSASSQFAQDTSYTLSVEGKDLAGNSLKGSSGFTFTTVGSAPDTTPPTLTDSSPLDEAIGVPRDSPIKLTFSEPMNKASVEQAFSITVPSTGNAGTFTWNSEGTEALFTPSASFAYGTIVKWSLTTGATDLAGNTLASASRSFRVTRLITVTLRSESGNEGLIYNFTTFSNVYPWPIGDDSNNKTFRAGKSFRLSELNSELTKITEATLVWPYLLNDCDNPSCDPFLLLGSFVVEPIYYGENFDPQNVWFTPSTGAPLLIDHEGALNVESGYCRVPVLDMVTDAWTNRLTRSWRAQFRLRFETLTNQDNQATKLEIDGSGMDLQVTFEYP